MYVFNWADLNDITVVGFFCDGYEPAEICSDREKVSNMIKWKYYNAVREEEVMIFM